MLVHNRSRAASLIARNITTPIEIVPIGVAPSECGVTSDASREALHIAPTAFVIGFAGVLPNEHGIRVLSRAVNRYLHRKRTDRSFWLSRVDPHLVCYEARWTSSLVDQRAIFVKPSTPDTIHHAYASMDVFVTPFPMHFQLVEVTEAMAAGVPVIAADSLSAHEIIQHGKSGWLLRSPGVASLVAALERFAAADRVQRTQWSADARNAAAGHSVEIVADQILALYQNLISSNRASKESASTQWGAVLERLDVEWELWNTRAQAAGAVLAGGRRPSKVPVLRHFVRAWCRFRSWISRREWSVKLLDLPVSDGTEDEPGLILLQIDGLSRDDIENALSKGRMPFVRKLLQREFYRIHTMYPGQPATTPAVLGELFYGVQQAVPAFGFRDHRTGRMVEMIQPSIAAMVQHELAQKGEGLLSEGSAYCDIYCGGADESSFCPATTGWQSLAEISLWRRMALFLMNVMSLLRIAGASLLEFVVAVYDCIVGLGNGHDVWRELLYVLRRVIVNTVLRELVAIGVEADATRGLAVVHANFLGYDENSHRRGPQSLFAHYALRGIDGAIRRIWNAAHASRRRDYHVWIMADHGQERAIDHKRAENRSVQAAVAEVYRSFPSAAVNKTPPTDGCVDQRPVESERAGWLRSGNVAPGQSNRAVGADDSRRRPFGLHLLAGRSRFRPV